MKYPDGQDIRLGDVVRLGKDAEGVVVSDMDTGEYSNEHPEVQWGYLKTGVMIEFKSTYGLIHYSDKPDSDLTLLRRASSQGEVST
jgi:hypothetical protein